MAHDILWAILAQNNQNQATADSAWCLGNDHNHMRWNSASCKLTAVNRRELPNAGNAAPSSQQPRPRLLVASWDPVRIRNSVYNIQKVQGIKKPDSSMIVVTRWRCIMVFLFTHINFYYNQLILISTHYGHVFYCNNTICLFGVFNCICGALTAIVRPPLRSIAVRRTWPEFYPDKQSLVSFWVDSNQPQQIPNNYDNSANIQKS